MIKLPEELLGMTDYDENDNWILKEGSTEKQRKVFENFQMDLESGKLTDTEISSR